MNKLLGTISWAIVIPIFISTSCASTNPNDPHRNYTQTEKARMLINIANGELIEKDPVSALESLSRAEAMAPNYLSSTIQKPSLITPGTISNLPLPRQKKQSNSNPTTQTRTTLWANSCSIQDATKKPFRH